ncbi:hypothetical protein, partial [Pseudorhodobacter sp.]|uniref:hypothetical protein n=1 Tax=Pseudorhodobacter sp. TaxID=1934400 RepID=UPI002647D42F
NSPHDVGPNINLIDGGSGNDIIGFEGGSTVIGEAGVDALALFDDLGDEAHAVITDFNPAQGFVAQILSGIHLVNPG